MWLDRVPFFRDEFAQVIVTAIGAHREISYEMSISGSRTHCVPLYTVLHQANRLR